MYCRRRIPWLKEPLKIFHLVSGLDNMIDGKEKGETKNLDEVREPVTQKTTFTTPIVIILIIIIFIYLQIIFKIILISNMQVAKKSCIACVQKTLDE